MTVEEKRHELLASISEIAEQIDKIYKRGVKLVILREASALLAVITVFILLLFGRRAGLVQTICLSVLVILSTAFVYTLKAKATEGKAQMPSGYLTEGAEINEYLENGEILDYDIIVTDIMMGRGRIINEVLYVRHGKAIGIINAKLNGIAVEQSKEETIKFAKKGDRISLVMLPEKFFKEKHGENNLDLSAKNG